VDFRFISPSLTALDEHGAEVVACCVWSDERPLRGLAGLLDWRLAGRISRLAKETFVKGTPGEVLCMQGKPRLPFDKVILVGAGAREAFDAGACKEATLALVRTLEGLHVKRAVVELPGRSGARIAPEIAAEIALGATRDSDAHDAWVLVESTEGQAKIASRANEERRRERV